MINLNLIDKFKNIYSFFYVEYFSCKVCQEKLNKNPEVDNVFTHGKHYVIAAGIAAEANLVTGGRF